jgi:DNA-binding HxlR family transcriptional regulator
VSKPVHSHCRAFQLAIDVLGRPWNALILNVLQGRPLRYSELSAAAHGPGDKVLSARLKELEKYGLISRHVDAGPPVRVSYELTARGRGFGDVAVAIERWGRCLGASETKSGRSYITAGRPASPRRRSRTGWRLARR